MNARIFILSVLSFCCASCSESDPATPEVEYKQADTYITSYQAEAGGVSGDIEGFFLVFAFNKSDACLLNQETYASFEMMSVNRLRFIGDFASGEGVLHIADGNIATYPYAPWRPSWSVSDYDYYQLLPVAASGEGVFVFRMKFYQPRTNEYFVTRAYILTLRLEDGIMNSEMRFADYANPKI